MTKEVAEDFDITPYQTEIDIEAPPISTDKLPPDVWYGYDIDHDRQSEKYYWHN